jgi:uncharacterized membrane protein
MIKTYQPKSKGVKSLEFWLALIIFLASHSMIARSGLRGFMINKWGESVYLIIYSFLSIALLAWLVITAQNASRIQLWPWLYELYWVPNLFMPFACILLVSGFIVPNPLSIAARESGFHPDKPNFTVVLTRHPILWGFFLWSASHIIPNGEYPLAVMFSIFALFSILGLKMIDKKRKRELGKECWALLAQNTHAILLCSSSLWTGRFQFTASDMKGIFLGLLLYILLYSFHGHLFGIVPHPPL